jgi:hypothetical protein
MRINLRTLRLCAEVLGGNVTWPVKTQGPFTSLRFGRDDRVIFELVGRRIQDLSDWLGWKPGAAHDLRFVAFRD